MLKCEKHDNELGNINAENLFGEIYLKLSGFPAPLGHFLDKFYIRNQVKVLKPEA